MSPLARFIKYLESEDLVKFDVLGKSERCFRNRLRIQKYAFLAKRFGLALPYRHGMFLNGPHSRTLSGACRSLANNPERYDAARPDLPKRFRSEEFHKFVRGRNVRWLETAATLLSIRGRFSKRDDLVEMTEWSKVGFTRRFIDRTLRDLERADMIKFAR